MAFSAPQRHGAGSAPRVRLFPLAMAALATALYANALFARDPATGDLRALHRFMLDDRLAIERHPLVFAREGLARLWITDYWAGNGDDRNLYRPLAVLSYHLNARLAGGRRGEAFWFRAVNVALLWAVACTTAAWLGGHVSPAAGWLAAAAIVAHPVDVELVGQVVGRADLQAMLGITGFLWLARRTRRWSPGSVAAGLAFAAIAFGSKETGLLLVPLAALDHAWLASRAARAAGRRVALLLGAPLVLYLAGRLVAVGAWPRYAPMAANDLTGNPLRGLEAADRLPAALATAWFYLRQCTWPDLGVYHVPVALPDWGSAQTWLGAMALAAGAAALAVCLRRRHWLSLPLTLAAGQFLLVGNLLAPSGVYASNRLMLPFVVAACAAAAAALDALLARGGRARRAALAAWCAALAALGAATAAANPRWRSMPELMAAEQARRPDDPLALYVYGASLLEVGDTRAATPWLERASAARPDSVEARWALARAYADTGRLEAALAQYEAIVERSPEELEALLQIVAISFERGDLGSAEHYLAKAARLAPEDRAVMRAGAALAQRRGRIDEAIARYRALLERHPDDERARRKLDELQAR